MIGLDTNVLVRYLVNDDPDQSDRAAALIDRASEAGERLFVTEVVICEIVWVLESAYRFDRPRIAAVVCDLLRARQLAIENADAVRRAVDRYAEERADFADFLILDRCRENTCERFASFDRALQGEDTVFSP